MHLFKIFLISVIFSTNLLATTWVVNESSTSASTSGGTTYDNNQDITATLSITGVPNILVTITGETEQGYDYLYITDSNNNVTSFNGTLNEAFIVNGSSITLRFTSDYSVTKSGVTVTISYDPDATSYINSTADFNLVNPPETRNIIGNTQIKGNTVECVTTTKYATEAQYNNSYKQLTCDNTVGNYNNNNYTTKFLDIDSNSSTYNSSSATIELPSTYKEIKWVGLFWQAHLNNNSIIYEKHSNSYKSSDYPSGGVVSTSANKVQLKIGSGTYQEVQASTVNYFNSSSYVRYSAFKDITSYFKSEYTANTNIEVTVANISASIGKESGLGNYGAWSIVIVYAEDETSNSSKLRNNSVYSGFQYVSSNSGDREINLTDFLLPKKGTIDSQMAVFAAEGEYRYSPDTMKLDGTPVGDPDKNNVFDARLSDNIVRNPTLINNDGIDIDVIDTSTIMTAKRDANPNATSYSSKITLSSDSDLYYPSMVAFTTELYKPRVCYYLGSVLDSNDNVIFENGAFTQGSALNPNEEYSFDFWISNMKKNAADTDIEIANKVQIYLDMNKFHYTSNSTIINNIDGINIKDNRNNVNVTDIDDINISGVMRKDDLGEHVGSRTTLRVGAGASYLEGGTLNPAENFADTKNITYFQLKGSLEINNDTETVNLLDYLNFKASFKTSSIDITADNAQLIAQCQDLNTSGSVAGAPGGYFNVVTTTNRPNIITNNADPLSSSNSPLNDNDNDIGTQVINQNMNISVMALDTDKVTPKAYKGVVALELIKQPNYLDSDTEEQKQEKCENAQKLAPIAPDLTHTVAFSGGQGALFVDDTFTYASTNKDASFRVKYVKLSSGGAAYSDECSSTSNNNCLWGLLTSVYGPRNQICATECKPGGGTGNNQASEACVACVFGGANTGSACSRDDFAIRPYSFRIFGQNKYKRAGENFNMTIKAVDQANFNKASGSVSSVQGTPDFNVSTNTLHFSSNFYTPSSEDIGQMQTDTGVTNVTTCPNNGTFNVVDNNFFNGDVNVSMNFSETGILDIHVSENNGSEFALVDADDTPDSQRLIQSTTTIYDNTDISQADLLLFVPYSLVTTANYNTTNAKSWLYMHDINGSATTPAMSSYITYTIIAKNKNAATTHNFTKTCFPDTANSAPTVNGLKLNTTFDLLLDASIQSSSNTNLSLYTEDNNSIAIWTKNPNKVIVKGNNNLQEWISPLSFTNGVGTAKVHFNIDRNNSVNLNPVTITVIDVNTSTLWMSNPGSPKKFTGATLNKSFNYIYGRTNAPRQRFAGNTGTAFIYYESYCSGTDVNNNTCDKSLLPDSTSSVSNDDPRWFQNTKHNSSTDGNAGTASTIVQKNSQTLVQTESLDDSNPVGVHLKYSGTSYPYKTTMTNQASPWLIYDPYKVKNVNEFQVEFINSNSSWAGKHETDTTTRSTANEKTNRRSMW